MFAVTNFVCVSAQEFEWVETDVSNAVVVSAFCFLLYFFFFFFLFISFFFFLFLRLIYYRDSNFFSLSLLSFFLAFFLTPAACYSYCAVVCCARRSRRCTSC